MSFGNNDMPPPSKNDFKPPLTVGRISEKKIKTSKLGKLDSFSVYENLLTNSHSLDENSTQKCDPVPAGELDSQSRKQLHPAQKCPYEEPPWGSQPKVEYRLAILKSGAIVGVTKLSKSFSVIGRHQDSDLVMEHPSISRFHAVLQYGKPDPHATDSAKHLGGFYLFDLGSTHGTQLNKQLIDAKSYRRVHVGHHMKFGFSSRTFILEGPVEDEEAESELSVSEIIEFHKERKAKWNRKLETGKAEKEEADRKEDEEEKNTSINWGMGEDATEDDGPISDEDPFALDGADDMNEQLYLDNPKKALRGWFEREGYELEYRVEERGSQQFLCRIELPIATEKASAIVVETSVKGRKKEAVVQCALEACRILDSRGELRKAWHDSHAKKNKNWKEDNYYDSDEDEFFDRTGDLASKREQRKSRLENRIRHVETYDSLKEKLSIAENAIESINKSLKESKTIEAANKVSGDAVDTLDSFMQQLKADHVLDNAKRSQLKLELARLLTERIRLIRLINIVKPTKLPPLRPMRYGQ
ncbi:coiled-coil protein-like [Tropilaelaps mercedesae]|uniref:Coiled-coil protein-like n=1 Tax=Tropilaelaps mercedesae TaxID=418985 RepID=A0A1V9X6I0_9ACAR|nr:coiled-coil protein-like [Tropilaelaps mercedesae]